MPEEVKKTLTGREKRQQGRIDKLTEERVEEAKAAGVDVKTPSDIIKSGPQTKSDIDAKINKGVKGDMREGLKKIQSLRQAPEVDIPEKPTIDLDIKDVRKNRRNKIANVMNAFGQGLAGEQVDAFKYTRPKDEERLAQYQQYKDASGAAKQKIREFETGYINEQLNYLNSKLSDPNLSDLKRKQIEKQIEKTKSEIRYKDKQTSLLGKDKDNSSQEKTVRVTEKRGDTSSTREVPLSEWKTTNDYDKALKAADNKVSEASYALEQFGNEGTAFWETKDKPIRVQLEADLSAAQEEKQRIIDSFGEGEATPEPAPTPTPTPNKTNSGSTNALKSIADGLKD